MVVLVAKKRRKERSANFATFRGLSETGNARLPEPKEKITKKKAGHCQLSGESLLYVGL
ncbi:hypothetical protein [Thalassobacillus sp. C254]|uniref:hypothetical protein n=1 Tax=Thalassobacillus sp. C254 TaxID=1225341 RepID=UPI0018DCFCC4|nr:hypothetical protein [Thalassobacillus sp. C254]